MKSFFCVLKFELSNYWSYVNILDTKSQTFYAVLLANNSHCSGVM